MAGKKKPKRPVGPPSERLVIEGDWQEAIKKAVIKRLPRSGVPSRMTKKRKKRTP